MFYLFWGIKWLLIIAFCLPEAGETYCDSAALMRVNWEAGPECGSVWSGSRGDGWSLAGHKPGGAGWVRDAGTTNLNLDKNWKFAFKNVVLIYTPIQWYLIIMHHKAFEHYLFKNYTSLTMSEAKYLFICLTIWIFFCELPLLSCIGALNTGQVLPMQWECPKCLVNPRSWCNLVSRIDTIPDLSELNVSWVGQ